MAIRHLLWGGHTKDTRSGISHSPDCRNSRTFPFFSQENNIQAIPFSISSTKPITSMTFLCDKLSSTRISLTKAYANWSQPLVMHSQVKSLTRRNFFSSASVLKRNFLTATFLLPDVCAPRPSKRRVAKMTSAWPPLPPELRPANSILEKPIRFPDRVASISCYTG